MIAQVGAPKRTSPCDILNTQLLMEDAPKTQRRPLRGLRAIVGEDRRGGGGLERSLYRNQRAAKGALHAQLTGFRGFPLAQCSA